MRTLLVASLTLAGALAWAADAPDPARLHPFHDKKNGGYGFIDVKGKIVVKPAWEKAFGFSEGLARVKTGGLYGFADATGKEVITPQFAVAGDFHDGRAPVERRKDAFQGWIDPTGALVLDAAKLGIARGEEFHDGLAQALKSDRTWGFIDPSGQWVVKAQFRSVQPFSEGHAVVGTPEFTFGVIDATGQWTVPATLKNEPTAFGNGLAYLRQDGGAHTYIGPDGQVVLTITVDESEVKAQFRGFHEGLAAFSEKGLWGYLDTTGKVVIAPKWAAAEGFSEGLAAVFDAKGRAGYIDARGKAVIKPKYKGAESFKRGLARVEDAKKGWLYLNPKGKVVGQAE